MACATTWNIGVFVKAPNKLRCSSSTIVLIAGQQIADAHNETKEAHARIADLEEKIASLMNRHATDVELDLNSLVIKPGRRRKLSLEQFNELKTNLAHNPLATPVSVRALPDNRFELIAGHNRVEAFRELGRTTIRATVLDVSEDEASRLAFYTNLLSLKPTDYQQYLGFKQRIADSGMTLRELESESGVPRSKIGRLMAFEKLPPAILEALDSAESCEWFSSTTAEAIAKLDVHQQERAVELLPDLQSGKLTLSAYLTKAAATTVKKELPVSLRHEFKAGRKLLAEMRLGPKGLSLSFKQEHLLSPALVEDLKKVITDHLGAS